MREPYLTMAEIERQYPNEWVLIDSPTTRGKLLEVTGGHVVLHCADRAEFLRRVEEWDGSGSRLSAVRYVGRFPEENDEVIPAGEEVVPHQPGVA